MSVGAPLTVGSPRSTRVTLVAAWAVVLLASSLPQVVGRELLGTPVDADQRALLALAVIGVGMLACFVWRPVRPLRPLLVVLGVLVGAQWVVYTRVDELGSYPRWLADPSFTVFMLAEQSLNLLVCLGIIAALLALGRTRRQFFLTRGDPAAPVAPIRWLGVGPGQGWNQFGPWLTLCISGGTLAFLVIAGRPDPGDLAALWPFLPAIVLAAAVNAFTEEVTYKASLLSVLEGPVGPHQSVLLVAAYFGIGHYYGVPYGLIGVLLAGFLGWILARSMVETRGMLWAWFVHFWQDVLIFSFLAVGSITAGG
jgi:hypothetical protein